MNGHDEQRAKNLEKFKWSVAKARQCFSELIRSAAHEPQRIYNRQHLVGVLIDAETFEAFQCWKDEQARRSIGAALDELREICQAEDYQFEAPSRTDRDNPFGRLPA